MLGLITHLRAAVPVVCLASVLGRPERPPGPSTCLLLVAVEDMRVAFAVDALRTIAPLTWTDADQSTRGDAADRGVTLRSAPLVRIGEDSHLLPDLDLRRIALRLRGRAEAPAIPAPRGALTSR
jgi:purine-binding chemotaxis protein CheW